MEYTRDDYTYVVTKSKKENDEYVATCLEWELVKVLGDTPTEALNNARSAVAHLMNDMDEEFPEPQNDSIFF